MRSLITCPLSIGRPSGAGGHSHSWPLAGRSITI